MTHSYQHKLNASLYSVQDIFHVSLGARASFCGRVFVLRFLNFQKIDEGFEKNSTDNEKKYLFFFSVILVK